jgi:TRAP-type C4-dicarboxylate transport system permease large subunit
MIELINLLITETVLAIYISGVVFSLMMRFFVLTLVVYIDKNSRLKEIKNTSKKIAKLVTTHSYLSLVWPVEILIFIYRDIEYMLKK